MVMLVANLTAPIKASEARMSQAIEIEAAIGLWSLEGPDGTCRLVLRRDAQAGVHGVHVERCTSALGKAAMGWRPGVEGVELLGELGRVLAIFKAQGVDAFASADGQYRLERAFEV